VPPYTSAPAASQAGEHLVAESVAIDRDREVDIAEFGHCASFLAGGKAGKESGRRAGLPLDCPLGLGPRSFSRRDHP